MESIGQAGNTNRTPKEPELLEEIKTFLLTLHDSDKATELLQKIEAEAAKANKPQTDF